MHEIALIKNMMAVLEKELDDPGVGDVKNVHLEVGELRYIVPEIMQTGFKYMPKHTKLNTAELKMKVIPVKVRCRGCETESESGSGFRDIKCASCGGDKVDIVSGNEFIVKGIEW